MDPRLLPRLETNRRRTSVRRAHVAAPYRGCVTRVTFYRRKVGFLV